MSRQNDSADEADALLEQLKRIALDYRAVLKDDGPTIKQLAHAADEIDRLASELAGRIEKQRADLERLAKLQPFDGAIGKFVNSAATSFIEALDYLSRLEGKLRAQIVAEIGSGDPDKPDKGGAPTAAHALAGSPQQRLANELAVFYLFNYGAPTKTDEGEFLNFVRRVHEIAVGRESNGFKGPGGKAVDVSKNLIEATEAAIKDVIHHVNALRQEHPDIPPDDVLLGPIKAIGELFQERKSRRKPAKPDTPQED